MFTYSAGRCFVSASRHDYGTGTCFVQTCIITAAKGESLTAGARSPMLMQEAVRQEIRSGVNILQAQDNQIVQEAYSIFKAQKNKLKAMSKRITNCDSQVLSIKATNIGVQRSLKDMNIKIVKVNKGLDSIKNSLKGIPSKRELTEHVAIMVDQLAQSP
jgi:hypothetical protein